jgi:hypothetical protein
MGRWAKQCRHRVLVILTPAWFPKNFLGPRRQAKRFIQFLVKERTAITGHPCAVKFQMHAEVKLDPQGLFFALTQQLSPFLLLEDQF